jgi:hypothetical protein
MEFKVKYKIGEVKNVYYKNTVSIIPKWLKNYLDTVDNYNALYNLKKNFSNEEKAIFNAFAKDETDIWSMRDKMDLRSAIKNGKKIPKVKTITRGKTKTLVFKI